MKWEGLMVGQPLEPPPLDFDTNEQRINQQNLADVAREIEERDARLAKRIRHFVGQFGVPEEAFWLALEEDPDGPLAAVLAKEARRQNIHEIAAADYVSHLPFVEDFVKLSPQGWQALYITTDGQIISGQDLAGADPPSKSIDFRWRTGTITCYGVQKFTKVGGGNQDNQFNEIEALLRQFLPRRNNDTALFILVDGAYYTESKLTQLRGLARLQSPFSYVTSVNSLSPILRGIVEAAH